MNESSEYCPDYYEVHEYKAFYPEVESTASPNVTHLLVPSGAPAVKRSSPYIWVTWLAALLSGDKQCEWAVWLQANYTFLKVDTDASYWIEQHDLLVRQRTKELESDGYTVYVEDENKFTITGRDRNTKIGGKPDIVAIKGKEIIVEDCKTGKEKPSDIFQVLLYMLLLPLSGGPMCCRNRTLEGRLIYQNSFSSSTQNVPSFLIDNDFREQFRFLVGRITEQLPDYIQKHPSYRECRFCKVPISCCLDRIERHSLSDEDSSDEWTDLF